IQFRTSLIGLTPMPLTLPTLPSGTTVTFSRYRWIQPASLITWQFTTCSLAVGTGSGLVGLQPAGQYEQSMACRAYSLDKQTVRWWNGLITWQSIAKWTLPIRTSTRLVQPIFQLLSLRNLATTRSQSARSRGLIVSLSSFVLSLMSLFRSYWMEEIQRRSNPFLQQAGQ